MAVRVNRTRRVSKSVIVNRAALTALGEGIADGLLAVGQRTLDLADVPDAPPYGVGLVKAGAYVVYIKGKKVGGNATLRRVDKSGIVLYVGFGSPDPKKAPYARFQEMGTVKQPARPFLTPAFMEAYDDLVPTMKPPVAAKLRSVR